MKAPIPKKACPKVNHLGLFVLMKIIQTLVTVIRPKDPAPIIIIDIHSPKLDYQLTKINIGIADSNANDANTLCSLRLLDFNCKNL